MGMVRTLAPALALLFISLFPAGRALAALDWSEVATAPDPDCSLTATAVFQNRLYLGSCTTPRIWRSLDGDTWYQVSPPEFADGDHENVWALFTFNGQLYAGVDNTTSNKIELWRSDDGMNWTMVTDDLVSAGGGTDVVAMFGDTLYLALGSSVLYTSSDGEEWEGSSHFNGEAGDLIVYDGSLYFSFKDNDVGVPFVYRTLDGVFWDPVTKNGFDRLHNEQIPCMAVYGDCLYAGTRATMLGAEILRTCDGDEWEPVATHGLGDEEHLEITNLLVFGDQLYATTAAADGAVAGAYVWRTRDGENWNLVNSPGFGWNGRFAISPTTLTGFNEQLYAAAGDPDDCAASAGMQGLWRTDNHLPVPDPDLVELETTWDQPVDFTLSVTDADNDDLNFSVSTAPAHGTVKFGATKTRVSATATYTPEEGYEGQVSFSWTATDGAMRSEPAEVRITISAPGNSGVGSGCVIHARGADIVPMFLLLAWALARVVLCRARSGS